MTKTFKEEMSAFERKVLASFVWLSFIEDVAYDHPKEFENTFGVDVHEIDDFYYSPHVVIFVRQNDDGDFENVFLDTNALVRWAAKYVDEEDMKPDEVDIE